MFNLDLNGIWKLKRTDDPEVMEGKVPGSVFNDLLAAGKIADPFYRDNAESAKEIASYDYVYYREFNITERAIEYERLILCCEGLDTLADIFINEKQIASTDNMHRTYEFDIKQFLLEGTNVIKVLLHSPVRFIEEKHANKPIWGFSDALDGFPHIRKAHYMFGWDWGPKIPDSGIWRNISIKGFCTGSLEDIYVTQQHHEGSVDLYIRIKTYNSAKNPLSLKFKISAPDGSIIEKIFVVDSCCENIKIHICNPDLWWPNGYGKQSLYNICVKLLDGEEQLDEKHFNIGLRILKIRKEKDEWGESFEFNINGVSIFAMGANYIPEDSLLPRCTVEQTEKLVKSCIDANFNCLRVWGGGIYPEDYFYDLCDRYGLIVWQDLMFACAVYDLDDRFADNIAKEAEDNIKRIRHHASLGMWCGNNEMEWGWVEWGFPKTEKLRSDYTKQFEVLLAKVAAVTDPNTFYWPSSPSSGGGFNNPNYENMGDAHYWDVWHGLKPFTDYRKFYFRFASEFGFQSFPSMKTIETFTLPEDRNIFSYVMEKHQKNGAANGKILYYLSENFKYPKDFEALLYTSQLLQAEAIKYGVEHWRRHRGRCMGAIYWQLNDCWPVASWTSIDYFGRWKALHYFAKRFFAPVMLSACEEGLKVSLHVANETMKPFTGEIRWKLRDNNSVVLIEGTKIVEIQPLCSVLCCELDFENVVNKALLKNTYLEYTLYSGNKSISGESLVFVKAKHFEFLDPKLAVTVKDIGDYFQLDIVAEAFAKYVGLDLSNADCIFSDNYFDLSAGENRTLTVRKESISSSLSIEQFSCMLKVKSIYDLG